MRFSDRSLHTSSICLLHTIAIHPNQKGDTSDFDVGDFKPYSFESEPQTYPTRSVDHNQPETSTSSTRTGNTSWCSCGKLNIMVTEVPEAYFGDGLFITESETFRAVCMNREVLKMTLRMLRMLMTLRMLRMLICEVTK